MTPGIVRVVVEVDAAGHFRVGAEGISPEVAEGMLLRALAGLQRELLAKRVVEVQRQGIVVTAKLPGDGGKGGIGVHEH